MNLLPCPKCEIEVEPVDLKHDGGEDLCCRWVYKCCGETFEGEAFDGTPGHRIDAEQMRLDISRGK